MASQEYTKMEMECEPQKSFRRGFPCSRQTGIVVLLGTVCMIIFIIMTSVIFSNQERKFSIMESWMNSHTSDLTSVKSDLQITGNDLEKKVSELQNLVSSLSSSLNMSGSSNPMTNEMHEKKLSNIETLMTDLGSSLNLLASKQEEKLQKMERQQNLSRTEVKSLMGSLRSAFSDVGSKLTMGGLMSSRIFIHTQQTMSDMASSLTNLKSSVEEMRLLVQSLSYKLSLTDMRIPGCIESDWVPFSNSCYLFSSNTMNWTQAKDYCEEHGALLLKLDEDSEKEWAFVNRLANPYNFWIGLTDETTGQWRWADDTPCTMNKVQWAPGEPNDWKGPKQEGGEDCAHITKLGNINDIHCSFKMRFICKGPKDS